MAELILTTNPGLEDLVADEFGALAARAGLAHGEIHFDRQRGAGPGRVRVETDATEDALRAVWSRMRSIHHAQRFVHRFEIPDDDPLGAIAAQVGALSIPGLADARSFRVTCARHGEHPFRSPDVERAAGAAVVARWGLPVELRTPALHLRVDVHERTCHVGVQYTAEALTRRLPRVYSPPAALKTNVAWALLRLAEPDPQAQTRILDPFCGSGTILLEAAAWLPEAALFGCDLNPRAVAGTLRNARALDAADEDAGDAIGTSVGTSVGTSAGTSAAPSVGTAGGRSAAPPAARSIESRLDVRAGDARALVDLWGEASMSHVVTNPPFGVRLGKEIDFVGFYRRILSEVARVLVPGGTLVTLVLDRGAFNRALAGSAGLERRHVRVVETGALHPAVFVLRRQGG